VFLLTSIKHYKVILITDTNTADVSMKMIFSPNFNH